MTGRVRGVWAAIAIAAIVSLGAFSPSRALAQEKRSKKKLEEAHAIYGQNAQQKRRGGAISERLKRLAGRKSKSASPSSD